MDWLQPLNKHLNKGLLFTCIALWISQPLKFLHHELSLLMPQNYSYYYLHNPFYIISSTHRTCLCETSSNALDQGMNSFSFKSTIRSLNTSIVNTVRESGVWYPLSMIIQIPILMFSCVHILSLLKKYFPWYLLNMAPHTFYQRVHYQGFQTHILQRNWPNCP